MMMISHFRPLGLIAAALIGGSATARPTQDSATLGDTAYSIPLGNGMHQHILYAAAVHPLGSIVMLPGGAGDVGVEADGDVRHDDNFVVRTRARWTNLGYAVVIPDTIDKANLRGARSSAGYADLVERLVAFAHDHSAGPVYLLGTSQGSIAAMNGAAHAAPGSVAGVVLTESVSIYGGSHETVFDADPQLVRIPALVVANRDDACKVAPPEMAPKIASAMTHSPDVHVAFVSGGQTKSTNSCGSLTPHGYYGIENPVIAMIKTWLQAHG